jgi:predicted dehydrogenase
MNLLFIGCGEIGSWHLYAASKISYIENIYIVDPSIKSQKIAKKRINNDSKIKYHWFNKINLKCANVDLCIISTRAQIRVNIIKDIHSELGIKNYLVEKLVSNSIEGINRLKIYSANHNLNIWVNCKTRTYKVYQKIKNLIYSGNPTDNQIEMRCYIGGVGLFTNGIHPLDLFSFIDNSIHFDKIFIELDDKPFITKRGTFDINGLLFGKTNNNNKFNINFNSDSQSPDMYSFSSTNGNFIVDHTAKCFFHCLRKNSWRWYKQKISEDWSISKMSIKFIDDILLTNKCQLPLFNETILSHKFLFDNISEEFRIKINHKSLDIPIS